MTVTIFRIETAKKSNYTLQPYKIVTSQVTYTLARSQLRAIDIYAASAKKTKASFDLN